MQQNPAYKEQFEVFCFAMPNPFAPPKFEAAQPLPPFPYKRIQTTQDRSIFMVCQQCMSRLAFGFGFILEYGERHASSERLG